MNEYTVGSITLPEVKTMKTTCKELVKPEELSVREFAILEVSKITVPSAIYTLKAYLQEEERKIVEYQLFATTRAINGIFFFKQKTAYEITEKADIAWIKGNLIGRLCVMEEDDILQFLDVLGKEARKGFIW